MFFAFVAVFLFCLGIYVYTFYSERKIARSTDTVYHPAPFLVYVIAAVLLLSLIWGMIRSFKYNSLWFLLLFGITNICFAVLVLIHNRMRYYISDTGIEEYHVFVKPTVIPYSDIHTYALCSHGNRKFFCFYTNESRLQLYYVSSSFEEKLLKKLEESGATRLEMPFLVRQEEERLLSMHRVKDDVRKAEVNAVKFSVLAVSLLVLFIGIGLLVGSGVRFAKYKSIPKSILRYEEVSYDNGIKIKSPSGIYSVRPDLVASFDKEGFDKVPVGSGITVYAENNQLLALSQGNREYLPLDQAEKKSTVLFVIGCVGGGVLMTVAAVVAALGYRYIQKLKKGNKDENLLSEKALRWCDEIKVYPKVSNTD